MKKNTLLTTILLLAAMLISSCGSSATTEVSDSTSESVEESKSAEQTYGNNGSDTSAPAIKSTRVFLAEPEEVSHSEPISIFMSTIGSGEFENGNGEKMTYKPSETEKGFDIENTVGDMLVHNSHEVSIGAPCLTGFTIKYNDRFKLTTEYFLRITPSESPGVYPTVNLDGGNSYEYFFNGGETKVGGKKEVIYENNGKKVTINVEEENKFSIVVNMYYYDADDYNHIVNNPNADKSLMKHRIRSVSISGKTDGTVILEKREDGWHLSGAEGEINLDPAADDEYLDLHRDELPIIINASKGDVIHIEEYIPEVQELYR